MKNKIEVTGLDKYGKEVTIIVKRPSTKEEREAQIYSGAVFNKLINGKEQLCFRDQIKDVLRDRGLWSDKKEEKVSQLDKQIEDKIKLLRKGGIKKSEAYKLALQISDDRRERLDILMDFTRLDRYCIESKVEDAKFDYLVYTSLLDEEGNRIFDSVDDYIENGEGEVINKAANEFASIYLGLSNNWEKDLPENKFLVKYGYMNEDLHFINKDGQLTTRSGKLVDKDGYFIDEDNNRVTINGEKVDEDGNIIIEFGEFLEDDEEENINQ